MSELTPGERNATCGETFEQARAEAWTCIQDQQALVNNCTVPDTEYYTNLCGCKAIFIDGMADCNGGNVQVPGIIESKVDKIYGDFDVICAVGNTVSWIEQHKALLVGLAVILAAICCICSLLAFAAVARSRDSQKLCDLQWWKHRSGTKAPRKASTATPVRLREVRFQSHGLR